jgi:hypothetical protein
MPAAEEEEVVVAQVLMGRSLTGGLQAKHTPTRSSGHCQKRRRIVWAQYREGIQKMNNKRKKKRANKRWLAKAKSV